MGKEMPELCVFRWITVLWFINIFTASVLNRVFTPALFKEN
jgi:hypothetical protein